MALNVMKLCRTGALLTRLKITPEIGLARLAALYVGKILKFIHIDWQPWSLLICALKNQSSPLTLCFVEFVVILYFVWVYQNFILLVP